MDDIKAFAGRSFANSRGSHGWDHTLRVHQLCMHIGRVEGADLEVLNLAAYLHDVGRSREDESKGTLCHAEVGSDITRDLLKDYPISPLKRENTVHAIKTHRFRGRHRPETLEAKVLYDADKLDAIGAIGIGRAFLFAGEIGARLHSTNPHPEDTEPYSEEDTGYREFKVKLLKIRDRILTREGRRIAKGRHTFMVMFFEKFLKEHEGIE
jgi:uncharacterized protein